MLRFEPKPLPSKIVSTQILKIAAPLVAAKPPTFSPSDILTGFLTVSSSSASGGATVARAAASAALDTTSKAAASAALVSPSTELAGAAAGSALPALFASDGAKSVKGGVVSGVYVKYSCVLVL